VKWQRAAHLALGRGAYVEADRLLRRALALVRELPESAGRLRVESDLLISLGTALFSTRGYGAPEVELVFKQAREVIGRLGDESSVGVVAGLASVHFTRSDRAESSELLPHLKRLAASTDDLVSRITGSAQLGVHAFWVGRLAAAQEYLGQAIALHDTPEFLAFARGYGYDGGLFCHAYHMLASWLLGLPEQALAMDRVIVDIATRTGNPYSRALALGFGACLAYDLADADGVARRADELADLSVREHFHLWLVIAACARGWALHLRGDPVSAAREMQAALGMLDGMGVRSSHAYFTPPLGVALGEAGEVRQALRVIDAELERADVLLAQVHVPELHRVRGELFARTGDLSDAERSFRTALGHAHASGALAYELRAATSLAAVLRDSQRAAEGRALLGGVLARFADGRDTQDLRRASTGLRDLG
jgi:tetratricopeptide (TPR) repeat protein